MTPESVDRLLAALSEVLGVRVAVIDLPKLAPYKPEPPKPAPEPAPLTLEDVKAAIIAAQKRTKAVFVQKAVMDRGGSVVDENGTVRPSLKALPASKYAEAVAAIEALPATYLPGY